MRIVEEYEIRLRKDEDNGKKKPTAPLTLQTNKYAVEIREVTKNMFMYKVEVLPIGQQLVRVKMNNGEQWNSAKAMNESSWVARR